MTTSKKTQAKQQRTYRTPEERAEIVRLVMAADDREAKLSELGVSGTSFYLWRSKPQKYLAAAPKPTQPPSQPAKPQSEQQPRRRRGRPPGVAQETGGTNLGRAVAAVEGALAPLSAEDRSRALASALLLIGLDEVALVILGGHAGPARLASAANGTARPPVTNGANGAAAHPA